jgi:archaellum biogenesis ATPase FlaH
LEDTTQYNTNDFQTTLINFMVSDQTSFIRVQNILDENYFMDNLRPVVRMIKEHADKYNTVPQPQQVKAMTGYTPDIFEGAGNDQSLVDWFMNSTEGFCRHRAIENVILKGPELIAKGQGADLERQIKDAVQISLVSDLGTAYFEDVRGRLERLKDRSAYVTTGFKSMDRKLGGGFTRGSLNVFAGGSGSGKSIFLQNIALSWALMGMNVIYITLELSEDLVNNRLDAMVSQFKTTELLKNIDDVALKIAKMRRGTGGKKAGEFMVKKFPEAGTTSNDIKAYLKEYQIKTGVKPDAVVIDYLDLMHPNNAKIDVGNLFTKDKYVSEEMRSIGGEWDIPVVTASQLNRQSVDAQEFDHSHIAGGISKINTADNVFGIFTSLTMRQNGKYQLQFLKTRSASAVGEKLELAYDPDCMRLSDMPDDWEERPVMNNQQTTQAAAATANLPWNGPSPTAAPPSPAANVRSEIDDLLGSFKKVGQ